MNKEVIILGAGASGLIAAIESARRKRSVLVIDHMKRIGNKIRISGGGRCNFTNLHVTAENYISLNSHFCKSALTQFTPADFMALLDRHHIRYGERSEGQLFCIRTAEDIISALQKEATAGGVDFSLGTVIKKMRKQKTFELVTDKGLFTADSVIVATGGLSYPDIGATNLGYTIAKEFGLKVTRLRPGLVPLLFDKNTARQFQDLSGTSLNVEISCKGIRVSGGMLMTHTGLSGPAVLQASLYWEEGESIAINLLPETDLLGFLTDHSQSRAQLANVLASFLPKRFAQRWTEMNDLARPLCQFSPREIGHIAHNLQNWEIRPAGTAGFSKAEVTLGGVDTGELSSKTMESKKVPGLYFIGEVIDVTGQLGGFNLQWAWSSGYAAGQHA
ncbi:MAG: aminoacetone oxidase family FAD-binding enzyme [Thermodesulfovibrio sp.]|nr:aminoacetone oxidase family FAD-binding enzyme [Thermodesulfovibrio sp.]